MKEFEELMDWRKNYVKEKKIKWINDNKIFAGLVFGENGKDLVISFSDGYLNLGMPSKFWQIMADEIKFIAKDEYWPINIETLEVIKDKVFNDLVKDLGIETMNEILKREKEILTIRKIILNGIRLKRKE